MRSHNIFELLEQVRTIAQLGLNYTRDVYDRERYERLLAIACGEYALLSGLAPDIISERFRSELGYITPKVGVSAAIFNESGEILLVRRTDDQSWCLPCGWAEVRETPQQSIAREVLEETELIVDVWELIRLGARMPGDFRLPHTTYHLEFFCEVVGGTLSESHETTSIGFTRSRRRANGISIISLKRWLPLSFGADIKSAKQGAIIPCGNPSFSTVPMQFDI